MIRLLLFFLPFSLSALPIRFEFNQGQFAPSVVYAARGIVLTANGPVFPHGIRMMLTGARMRPPQPGPPSGNVRYFARDFPRTVPQFTTARYPDVYPGIDLVFRDGGETGVRFRRRSRSRHPRHPHPLSRSTARRHRVRRTGSRWTAAPAARRVSGIRRGAPLHRRQLPPELRRSPLRTGRLTIAPCRWSSTPCSRTPPMPVAREPRPATPLRWIPRATPTWPAATGFRRFRAPERRHFDARLPHQDGSGGREDARHCGNRRREHRRHGDRRRRRRCRHRQHHHRRRISRPHQGRLPGGSYGVRGPLHPGRCWLPGGVHCDVCRRAVRRCARPGRRDLRDWLRRRDVSNHGRSRCRRRRAAETTLSYSSSPPTVPTPPTRLFSVAAAPTPAAGSQSTQRGGR